jgi:Tfp pilus assembly protein PilV
MKELVCKVRAILKKTRGESLMECIVSILVFSVLIAAVTTMIMTSMKITGKATQAAEAMQKDINAVVSGTASSANKTVGLEIQADGVMVNNINISVAVYSAGDFIAFYPREGGEP